MKFGSQNTDKITLVPHSGIQFYTLGFDLQTMPQFARSFIGHKFLDQARADGTVPMELLAGWNEDDPEGEPPHQVTGDDDEYRIAKDKAVDTFLDRWIPVPFLAVRPGLDAQGREILDSGPIDWVRLRISAAEPGAKLNGVPISHYVIFAFDTEILKPDQSVYAAPTPENVRSQQEFTFASRFSDVTRFLASGDARPRSDKARVMSWVDQWLFEAYVDAREQQTGRRMRDEEKKTVEHLARYVALVQFINAAVPVPRTRLVDTYSEMQRVRPVLVDLVLDIGNSRTCGILIETYPNDSNTSLSNTVVLGLRNLSEPHRIYREPFESHVEFAQAHFGSRRLSRQVRGKSAFFWPSPVRIGPEATRFREMAQGSEATSGMSSPKRYLCDLMPVNQEWKFQPGDYDSEENAPLVALRLFRFVNQRGDVNREVIAEPALYKLLADSIGSTDTGGAAARQAYSRSSIFTFMLCEIVAQAWSMVNNAQFRKVRREGDAPRVLKQIYLSLPTAMPVQEQRIMRSRAQAAVKLMWDMMGWTEEAPPNLEAPTVRVSWDEATCSQLVYLYNEVVEKFSGNVNEFFSLMGKPRPFVDPEQRDLRVGDGKPTNSLRVASVDVGGGTTDVMITTYHVEGDHALNPIQNFREGFRIAGDEALREIIQQTVLRPLGVYLRQAGISSPQEFLNDRFGGIGGNMTIQEQHLRREFVLRVLQPAGLGVIKAAEAADFASEERVEITTLGALLGKASGEDSAIPARIRNYIEEEAKKEKWGAVSFSLEACPIPLDMTRVRAAVSAALGDVFDNIAEAINHLDCDVVLLSGRPTRLPATIDLFVDKLAASPDRVVPFSRYQVGKWYPFASRASYRIDDPKTATAVGCLLGNLFESQVMGLTVYTERFSLRSTAKYIGELQGTGKLPDSNLCFRWNDDPKIAAEEVAKISYYAPMRLGYRQLPIERWTATPLYRLKLSASSSLARVKLPVTIELGRRTNQQMEKNQQIMDVKDQQAFTANEALKEALEVRDAYDRQGSGGMKRLFSLNLDTLPSEEGYWLDTGILTVG